MSIALETLSFGNRGHASPGPWTATQPGYSLTDQDDEASRGGKRSRVALACQRCKTRKQKCDGTQPCQKCRSNNHDCEYVMPQKAMPFGKNRYIKALEQRVAELETILASTAGMAELSSDHWQAIAAGSTAGTSEGQSVPTSDPGAESGDEDPDEAVLDWQDGVESVVAVLRSLSLDVNGSGYVGASSHMALGRLFSFLGKKKQEDGKSQTRRASHQSSSFNAPAGSSTLGGNDTLDLVDLADVPAATANRLFAGYLKHISTRWPVVHTVWAREIHERRHSLTDAYEITILHLVYATAGRFIETTGEVGDFCVKRHYASALQSLDIILEFNDMRTIRALMLMAVYCLRDPVGAGAWTYSRTALLVAIDHGLHRQTKALSRISLENELRKRLFWSCYAFDRQISIPMGRPFGISDRDIDIDLPLDVDENITEDRLQSIDSTSYSRFHRRTNSTSLTSFIHIVRLRQIESDIQQTIYRVDKSNPLDDSVIDSFLGRLEHWKAMIPENSRRFKDAMDVPYDGYEYYMIFYYKCQRLLLYPQISKSTVSPRFLKECAKACAGVCGTYKRLHQSLAVGYSSMSLQTVFMAGLTLVYCIWLSPDNIFDLVTSNGIHDCSIVLFVIAERVPSAKRYRNAFEVIRQKVIDNISQQPERKHRETVIGLTEELAAPSLYSLQSQSNFIFEVEDSSYEEFSHIIRDMTGDAFPFLEGGEVTTGQDGSSIDVMPRYEMSETPGLTLAHHADNPEMFRFPDNEFGAQVQYNNAPSGHQSGTRA